MAFVFFRSSDGSSDTESESSSASDSSSGDRKADRRVSGRKIQADKAKNNQGMGIYLILDICCTQSSLAFPPHMG